MKIKHSTLLTLLLLCSSFSFGQTFNWTDTDFHLGSKRKIYVQYYGTDNGDELKFPALDTVVRFLKKNPNLKIEVANYTDPNGSPEHNYKLSEARAQSCVDYLISQGIDSVRLVAKGYGYSQPLITRQQIDAMKTKKERDAAEQLDRRTEIVIIGK